MPIAWCVPELPPNGAQRITATFQYCQAALWPAGPPHRGAPWFGLSRVKGNFHARFLGGRERVTARAYPTVQAGAPKPNPYQFIREVEPLVWSTYIMVSNISERDGVTGAGIEESTPLVLGLEAVGEGQRAAVGGKAANLAVLLRAGMPVPRGFCITTAAFDHFLAACPGRARLAELLSHCATARIEQIAV